MADAAPLTFRPTLAELGDWEGLVATMERRGAHLTGVARLVMPEGWVARRQGYSPDTIPLTIASPLTQRILPTGVRGAFDHHAERHLAPLTVPEYHRLATSPPHLPPPGAPRNLERLYWARPLTTALPPIYGADVAATLMDADLQVFNLDRLNSGRQAVLFHDQGPELGGIHTPYLFFGMWGSTFSWHVEDMDLYGLNYHHHGAPKQWYVVPPSQAHKLECLARRLFPQDAAVCHNLLRHKSVLLQPALLEANGVTVHRVLQRAGHVIVVFPSAYHAGFNHGYNVAEAINFGTERWLEYGMRARGCLCAGRGEAVRIDMAPLLAELRPAAASRAGEHFRLHPEDPPHLAAFLAHATERFARGKVTEGEMEEITRELREFATIPAWYRQKFGVNFEVDEEVVAMEEEEEEGWDKARPVRDIAIRLKEVEEVSRSPGKLKYIEKKAIQDREGGKGVISVKKVRIGMQKKAKDAKDRSEDGASASKGSEGRKEFEDTNVKESRPEELMKKEINAEEEGEEESKADEAAKKTVNKKARRSSMAAPAMVECSLCRLEFNPSLLRRHSRLAHTVPCEEAGCGAMAESAAHLAAHTRRVHRSPSPCLLQCLACGQVIPPGPGFQQHIHTPHPHDCSHCDLVFIEESELMSHMTKEHSKQENETKEPSVNAEKSLKNRGEEEKSKENCEEKRVENCIKVEGGVDHMDGNVQELENMEEETRVYRQGSEVEDTTHKQSQEESKEQNGQKEEGAKEPSEEHREDNAKDESSVPSEGETSETGDEKQERRDVERISAKKLKAENIQKGMPVVSLRKIEAKAVEEASLNRRKRGCVTEGLERGKEFGFNLDTATVTAGSKRMKFLHLSSEVQGEVFEGKRREKMVVLGQHVSIDCPVTCSECGKRFRNKSKLIRHMTGVHLQQKVMVKTFKCEEPNCNVELDRRERVKEHMRRAHGQPRLVCQGEGCAKTFISRRSMDDHVKTVHLKVRVNKVQKQDCEKKFNQKQMFKCEEPDCEVQYNRREAMGDHMRQVHGEPKLLCDVEGCGKEYVHAGTLRKHLKTSHEG